MPIETRTYHVRGKAYAASGDVTLTCTVDGTQVYNTTVTTTTGATEDPATTDVHDSDLFTFTDDTPRAKTTQSWSIAVSGGDIILDSIAGDYVFGETSSDVVPFQAAESANIPGRAGKSNIAIDGVSINRSSVGDASYLVEDGSTITFTCHVPGWSTPAEAAAYANS